MKNWLMLVILSLSVLTVYPQVSLTGKVVDAENNASLSNVIVMLRNSQGRVIKYTQTDNDGLFSLNVSDDMASSCNISFSLMSYKTKSYALKGNNQELNVCLEQTSIHIKEVVVKARRIGEQGDTLIYNVAGFATEQDKSIGDVLKKMPGINVDKEGKIKYNGVDINKFYIEGKDLLEGRYGIATKGISYRDVGRVEVMENHQPIKVMAGFSFSDQAAINLKLKDRAKAQWVGTFESEGGYSGSKNVLWNSVLFGLLIKKSMQNITTLKSNNTGLNIGNDIQNFYSNAWNENSTMMGLRNYINISPKRFSNLEEERTLFNRSHLISTSQLWETSKKLQVKTQVDYLNNREADNNWLETVYFLPDSARVISEDEQGVSRQNHLGGRVMLEANKDNFYLNHVLSTNIQWNDVDLQTGGSYPNRQSAWMPSYQLGSHLQWMQRLGKKLITFTSNNQLCSRPQHLDILQNEKQLYQSTDAKVFYTNENASYSLVLNKFVLTLKGGMAGLLRSMDSKLEGVSLSSNQVVNDITSNNLQLYVAPQLEYEIGRWNFTLNVPVNYYHWNFGSDLQLKNDVLFSPQLVARWNLNSRLSVSVSGQVSSQGYDVGNYYNGLILTDYRTLKSGYETYDTSVGKSIIGSIYYKRSLEELFANLSIFPLWNSSPYQNEQCFVDDFLLYSYRKQPVSSDSWFFIGNLSKGVDFIRGIATLKANYGLSDISLVAENKLVSYRSSSGNMSMDIYGQPSTWLDWFYQISYGFSSLESDIQEKEVLDSWQHTFKLNIIPHKKVIFTLSGEYYRNEMSKNVYKDLLLADTKLTYKWKDFELYIKVRNLFNSKEYGYNVHNELTSISCLQRIRGREFLIGFNWKK